MNINHAFSVSFSTRQARSGAETLPHKYSKNRRRVQSLHTVNTGTHGSTNMPTDAAWIRRMCRYLPLLMLRHEVYECEVNVKAWCL